MNRYEIALGKTPPVVNPPLTQKTESRAFYGFQDTQQQSRAYQEYQRSQQYHDYQRSLGLIHQVNEIRQALIHAGIMTDNRSVDYRNNPIGFLPTEDPSHSTHILDRRLASLQGLATQMPYPGPNWGMVEEQQRRQVLDYINNLSPRTEP